MPLSTEDLESRVQSSRHEMLKYLESVHAFEFNGTLLENSEELLSRIESED